MFAQVAKLIFATPLEKRIVILKIKLVALSVGLLFGTLANAKAVSPNNQQPTVIESEMVESANSAVTDEQLEAYFSNLTPLEKRKAKNWDLTEKEWSRYKMLLETTQRAIWTPNIDPITLLGVEARTNSERERYARLFNKLEEARVKKELNFAFAQSLDLKRKSPDSNAWKSYIDQREERRISYHNQGDLSKGSPVANSEWETTTYLAYVNLSKECDASCVAKMSDALDNPRVDIYFTNAKSDEDIYDFARTLQIETPRVQSGQVTLNYGDENVIPRFIGPVMVKKLTGNNPAQTLN